MNDSDSSLGSICAELESELTRLTQRSAELKEELNTNDSERKRVAAALRALKKDKKTKPAARKPSASKADVIEIVASVLHKGKTVPEVEIRREVDRRVSAAGKSRMGLALRMKEALSDARFVETEDGYRFSKSDANGVGGKE